MRKPLDDHRDVIASLRIEKQSNTNKLISMTINDHRGTSGHILGEKAKPETPRSGEG